MNKLVDYSGDNNNYKYDEENDSHIGVNYN